MIDFKPLEIKQKRDQWDFAYVFEADYLSEFINFRTIDISDNDRIILRFKFRYNRNKFEVVKYEAVNLESDRNVTTLINIKNISGVLEDFIQEMLNINNESSNFRKLF